MFCGRAADRNLFLLRPLLELFGGTRMTFPDPKEFVLLFRRECAEVLLARDLLRDTGVSFNEVCLDDLPGDDTRRKYRSPTLLDGAVVVFGGVEALDESSGDFGMITEYELLRRLYDDVDAL